MTELDRLREEHRAMAAPYPLVDALERYVAALEAALAERDKMLREAARDYAAEMHDDHDVDGPTWRQFIESYMADLHRRVSEEGT